MVTFGPLHQMLYQTHTKTMNNHVSHVFSLCASFFGIIQINEINLCVCLFIFLPTFPKFVVKKTCVPKINKKVLKSIKLHFFLKIYRNA